MTQHKYMTLAQCEPNQEYVVHSIIGGEAISQRLRAMGFVSSMSFKIVANTGKGGPVSVLMKGSKIAIGRGMAENILVQVRKKPGKNTVVALAGNPNSGKTTVFNNLTGSRQHVGNYPGVTVEKKEGYCSHKGYQLTFVDLPGTYSITAYSLEERVARNYIIDEKPDVVIDVIDASNLERNLYLATQLMELRVPIILLFNKNDIAESHGYKIDIAKLSELIGVPIITSVGHKKIGMDTLLDAVVAVLERGICCDFPVISYGEEIEDEIDTIASMPASEKKITEKYSLRWCAIKLLEQDTEIIEFVSKTYSSYDHLQDQIQKSIHHIKTVFGDVPEIIFADKRYGFISGACAESVVHTVDQRHDMSDQIDKVLTNHVIGLPIFLGLIWLVFQLTFKIGDIPKSWIEQGLFSFKLFVSHHISHELLRSMLVDGVISGVGAVISFLPNILFLFLAIAFLEDSGYMARVAFIMDRIMHKIGLHGKSFIPMIIGFGCTVPAYMSSRILESREDRLITMHVNTFMSCGARLPVYILICGAFWPDNAGNVIFFLYFLGITVAVFSAKLFRMTRFKGMSAPFVIELPPYRIPTLRGMFLHMWSRCWLYVRKAGTVILGISIIMWFLASFPRPESYSKEYEQLIKELKKELQEKADSPENVYPKISLLRNQLAYENLVHSYAGRIGKGIEPILKPLGFDWRLGIGIFAGIAAKEAIVSTMATVYNIKGADEQSSSLREKLRSDPLYSPLIAFAFLVFILLYIPCIPALIVFQSESASFKETLFQIIYTFSVAWIIAFIIYQGGRILGLG